MNGRVLALGMFDGVHVGHQRLLNTARELADAHNAQLVVSTFSNHPSRTLHRHDVKWLTPPRERAELLRKFGTDIIEEIAFTREFARMTADEYIAKLNVIAVVCGASHTFGAGGLGDAQTLLGAGIMTVVVPPVMFENAPVSSTRIRAALSKGDLPGVNAMLGRAYAVSGEVIHGRGFGCKLGFPTANIALPEERTLPTYGAYASWVYYEGTQYAAALNIGAHPTIPGDARIEAHLRDFSGDLYGARIEAEFVKLLRREMRFDDIEALTRQVSKDIQNAWHILQ